MSLVIPTRLKDGVGIIKILNIIVNDIKIIKIMSNFLLFLIRPVVHDFNCALIALMVEYSISQFAKSLKVRSTFL